MPLIALATIVIAAGLFAGLGGDVVPGPWEWVAGGSAIAVACWRATSSGTGGLGITRRAVPGGGPRAWLSGALGGRGSRAWLRGALGGRGSRAALALLLFASLLIGRAARREDAACLATAAAVRAWTVRLDAPAAPGGYVRGTLLGERCTLPIALAIVTGHARDGSIVHVRGDPAESRRGLLIRRASVRALRPPAGLAAARARARELVDEVFRRDAPVARALLVADTRLLSPEIRERYAAAGLVHILSISGLHVGIIAAAAQLVFGAARLSTRAALTATITTILVYVAILGFPAPACRSAAMLGTVVAARLAQRPTSPWAALSLGALLPLVQPRTILELGYHLSVGGVAALMGAGAFSRRVLAPRLRGWRLVIARDLTASTIATLATAPLVASVFGVVSLVGPLTNLAAGPLLVVLQPMLFLALLAAPVGGLATFIADAAHPLLRLLDAIAAVGAATPHATMPVAPSGGASLVAGATAVAAICACVARFPMRPALAALLGVTLLAWMPLLPAPPRDVEMHVIDVGQGDAIALRTDRGRWILIDAGRRWSGGDEGRATVLPYLRRRGGTLAAFVLSHAHADHAGGAATIVQAMRPAIFIDAGFVAGSDIYAGLLAAVGASGATWRRARPGDSLAVDGVVMTVLAPDSAWTASLADPNDASVVVLLRYGAVRFLLVGDAERNEEDWLREFAASLRADVLKVGHHGSRTSSSSEFLEAVAPRAAVISVGAGNMYGHPSAEVLRELAGRGIDILRTDLMGTVVIRTDGESVRVQVDDVSWALPDPS